MPAIAALDDLKAAQQDNPPRPLKEIEADIRAIEQDIVRMLGEVTGRPSGAS